MRGSGFEVGCALLSVGQPMRFDTMSVTNRYTMIRSGRRKLMIPNSAFLTREFVIVEEEEVARTHSVHGTNNGTQQYNGTTNGDQHTVENPLSNGVTMNGVKTNGVPHEVMATRDASMEST